MDDPGVHHSSAIVDGDVFGRYLNHGVPVAGRNVGIKALVYPRRGVLERRSRMLFLEPCMHGVESRDCGVHVFEVEPHLQRDSTFLVDAV